VGKGYTLRETPGVAIDELPSGAWRVRWRENGKQVSRSRPTQIEAEALAREIAAARLRREPAKVDETTTVGAVFTAWLRDRKRYGVAPSTLARYLATTDRLLKGLRAVRGIADGRPVPASVLTAATVAELTQHLRTGERPLAESTIRIELGVLADAWTWASDDPAAWPGLPPAPRDRRRIVPRALVWEAPEAPSLAECDAVLRELATDVRNEVALPAAVIMRSTGLRIGQVLGIRGGDVHVEARTLFVRTGKTAKEKAAPRTVPIPVHLLEHLLPLLEGRSVDELLVESSSRLPSRTLHRAWKRATDAGLARLEVWAPPNRQIARPDHAFRAAYQAHLVNAGVRDEVIDLLVGHAGGIRASHYASASSRWTAMVDAVALIPPVDWRVELDNVVELPR
jgi:integrase